MSRLFVHRGIFPLRHLLFLPQRCLLHGKHISLSIACIITMGFWGNLCAHALALFQQSPVLLTQEYLTPPSWNLGHSKREFPLTHASEIFNTQLPNLNGVANVYNISYSTNDECNTAQDRNIWCKNTTISTDYEIVELVPNTGKTNYVSCSQPQFGL